jgi:hypothetical protein
MLGYGLINASKFGLGVAHKTVRNALSTLYTKLQVWVRVGGMVIEFLGVYYVLAAKHGLRTLLAWTVATRASVIVVFAVLVPTGLGPAVLLLFGAVDLAGAVWTWVALRRDAA